MHTEVIAPLFNFAVVVFILWYFGRRPVAEAYRTRSDTIATAIRGAELEAADAGRALNEWETKWKASEAEAKQNRDDAERRMASLRETSLATANKQGSRILEEARLIGQSEATKGREGLQREVVRRSVVMAKEYLTANLSDKDRHKLVEEYVELLGNGAAK